MGLDAPDEESVAVVDQVVRGDGALEAVARGGFDEINPKGSRDVLHHNLEGRKIRDYWGDHLLDEHLFPVEDVDFGTRHLRVNAEDQAQLLRQA